MYGIQFLLGLLGITSASLVINTNSGPIRGTNSLEGVEAFLGIPYAEAPIGELRFSKPIPKQNWTNVYNATKLPPPCPQYSFDKDYYYMPDLSNMSEDCLYLNIWTPSSDSFQVLKPVVIYIHPGGFVTGSSTVDAHDGSRLAGRGDVVVASINYRLGSFGFFLAYIEEANGNMGMFDQVLAIRWIKENAKHFGGDPENIVLMGASAGAISISMHMVSPLSQDLFHRAIIQSGSAVTPVLMDNNTGLFESSKQVSVYLGCANSTTTLENDPKSVVDCLKLKGKEDFLEAEKIIFKGKPVVFCPRLGDEFLPENDIADFFRGGKFRKNINVLAGVAKNEGTMLLMASVPEYFGNYGRAYEDNMSKIRSLTIIRALLSSLKQSKPNEITNFYLKGVKNRTAMEYLKMVGNIIGDFTVACSTIFLSDFLSVKGNTVYFYKFEFKSPSTPLAEWIGTTHLDDVQYVFGNPYHSNFTDEEIALSHSMIDRWSAFAKTGNPNIAGHIPWFPYSYETPLYLNFGQEEESIRMTPIDRCEIWRRRFNSLIDSELVQALRNSEIP